METTYQHFKRLDPQVDAEEYEFLVRKVVCMLDVHALLEEECLYPQARDALFSANLVDEAEAEHGAMRRLIQQLQSMAADDDKFSARFTVLCEYAIHHAKEEEDKLFPELRRIELEWPAIGRNIDRRRELLAAEGTGTVSAPSKLNFGGDRRLRPAGRDGPGPTAYRVPAAKT
ncbi:MAG: hemerythrin domain-containing protein [Burkholderiales bacterium]